MSTIDLHKQHFSNDGGLWIVPDRIQQTGDQVSEGPTEIRAETEQRRERPGATGDEASFTEKEEEKTHLCSSFKALAAIS